MMALSLSKWKYKSTDCIISWEIKNLNSQLIEYYMKKFAIKIC